MNGLWRQPHVNAHGNAALGQKADSACQPGGTFDFHYMGTSAHEYGSIGQGLIFRGIAHERHVADQQSPFIGAVNAGSVIGHLLQRYRQSAVMTLQHHAQRVAHEQCLHPRLTGLTGEGRIVGGQAGEFFTFALEGIQGAESNGRSNGL